MNFYNEHDPKAAAWLRELIRQGHIANGVVDERDIQDIRADELKDYRQCHFFAGIGGWSLALRLAGIGDDERVWTGSCPCQPFSQAGKGLGEDDERHLWPDFRNLIGKCRPPIVFGEQVASKAGRLWLAGVSADMEKASYAFGGADLCAAGVGAPHIRQRLYWVAHSKGSHWRAEQQSGEQTRGGGGVPSGNRAAVGVAESEHPERRPEREHRENVVGRCYSGRKEAHSQLGTCGEVFGMEHASGIGRDERRTEPVGRSAEPRCESGRLVQSDSSRRESGKSSSQNFGHGSAAEPTGSDCWMGEPIQQGLEGHTGNGEDGREPGRLNPEQARSITTPSSIGFWSKYYCLTMLDGKTRRVESGSFPLAHGFPGRVGLLRGYGNAIVPQVAAEFVAASIEALNL